MQKKAMGTTASAMESHLWPTFDVRAYVRGSRFLTAVRDLDEDIIVGKMKKCLAKLQRHPDCHAWTLGSTDAPDKVTQDQATVTLQMCLGVLLNKRSLRRTTRAGIIQCLASSAWVPAKWAQDVAFWHARAYRTPNNNAAMQFYERPDLAADLIAPSALAKQLMDCYMTQVLDAHARSPKEQEQTLAVLTEIAQWVRIEAWSPERVSPSDLATRGCAVILRVFNTHPCKLEAADWTQSIGLWTLLSHVHSLSQLSGLPASVVDMLQSKVWHMLRALPVFPHLVPSRLEADNAAWIVSQAPFIDVLGLTWVRRLLNMKTSPEFSLWEPVGGVEAYVPRLPVDDGFWPMLPALPENYYEDSYYNSNKIIAERLQGVIAAGLRAWLFPVQAGPVTVRCSLLELLHIVLVGEWVPQCWGPALTQWWLYSLKRAKRRFTPCLVHLPEVEEARPVFSPRDLAMLLLVAVPPELAKKQRDRPSTDAYPELVLDCMVTHIGHVVDVGDFNAGVWEGRVHPTALAAFRLGWTVCTRVLRGLHKHYLTTSTLPSLNEWESALGLWCLLKSCIGEGRRRDTADLVTRLLESVPRSGQDPRGPFVKYVRSRRCLDDLPDMLAFVEGAWLHWDHVLCLAQYGFPLTYARLHAELTTPSYLLYEDMLSTFAYVGHARAQLRDAIQRLPDHPFHARWVSVQEALPPLPRGLRPPLPAPAPVLPAAFDESRGA